MKRSRDFLTIAAMLSLVIPVVTLATRVKTSGQAAKTQNSTTADTVTGRRNFQKFGCYECHGLEGQGSIVTGPRLAPDPIPLDSLIAYVRQPTGQMPPYTEKALPDRDIAAIYAFLRSIQPPSPVATIPILADDKVH
jgi:ubiquinol-cytochrome c reductase cytochrome c subunit